MKCGAVIIENRFDVIDIIDRHKKFLPDSWEIIHINDPTIKDLQDYTNLLVSKDFWNSLPFDKTLIFQHDSGLLRHGINDFIEWDYVGAPWKNYLPYGGNGGLSLRSREAMLEVISSHPYTREMGAEDVYFSQNLVKSNFKLAPPEICAQFSCEQIYKLGTLGYHAIDKCLSLCEGHAVKTQYFKTVEDFFNFHKNQEAWIVGKGKSLKFLKKENIGTGIVFTINESILALENLGIPNIIYSVQKDGASPAFINKCQCQEGLIPCSFNMVRPVYSTLLIHELESIECMKSYPLRITFNNERMGLKWHDPSMFSIIEIAKLMGCSKLNFVSFDSITNNSDENFTPLKGSSKGNYVMHNKWLMETIKDFPHTFVTPVK